MLDSLVPTSTTPQWGQPKGSLQPPLLLSALKAASAWNATSNSAARQLATDSQSDSGRSSVISAVVKMPLLRTRLTHNNRREKMNHLPRNRATSSHDEEASAAVPEELPIDLVTSADEETSTGPPPARKRRRDDSSPDAKSAVEIWRNLKTGKSDAISGRNERKQERRGGKASRKTDDVPPHRPHWRS